MREIQARSPSPPQPESGRAAALARARSGPGVHRVLGRGRSGLVYEEPQPTGESLAVKVFLGDPAGDLVTTLLTGAPAPYAWNDAAVRAAAHRRNVLAELVTFWFGDLLRVARARDVRWNPRARAWELRAELVDGRPAALHHPFSAATDGEQAELVEQVMRPLQGHLRSAGFVGMLWQAGLGNPVAADNFLRDRSGASRWVWIDLESGVPALFPLDPRPLLGTYLPWSLRLGRPLFDDTDVGALRAYVAQHRGRLHETLSDEALRTLEREIDHLEAAQAEWKRPGRLESGVTAALARGRIDEATAAHYYERPLAWVAAEMRRQLGRAGRQALEAVQEAMRWLRAMRPAEAVRGAWRFATSHTVRERAARRLVLQRIRSWRRRGAMSSREVAYLRRRSREIDQAAYLSDFVTHLALKPVYKAVAWVVLPIGVQAGFVPVWLAAGALVAGGSVTRTAYTLCRGVQSLVRRRAFPWTALVVGALPVVGSAAYPAQILRSSASRDGKLAGLILYDTVTTVGRRIPVWGGADSRVEHWFNRQGDLLVRHREPLLVPVEPAGRAG